MGIPPHKAKYPVQTLEKSLEVLLYIKNNSTRSGLSIAEISEAINMPKSGVHRILDTFMEYDFIEKNTSSQTYRLGWGLYVAGNSIPLQYSISTVDYIPIMQSLCDKLQETVNIGIPRENDVIIISTIEPNRRLRPSVGVGEREPMYATALGKIFISTWNDNDIVSFMEKAPLEKLTPRTITSAPEMLAEIAGVRKCGFAVDREEFCEGLTCLAMPIHDHFGKIVATISVSGVSTRITEERMQQIIVDLSEVSASISAMLGYSK